MRMLLWVQRGKSRRQRAPTHMKPQLFIYFLKKLMLILSLSICGKLYNKWIMGKRSCPTHKYKKKTPTDRHSRGIEWERGKNILSSLFVPHHPKSQFDTIDLVVDLDIVFFLHVPTTFTQFHIHQAYPYCPYEMTRIIESICHRLHVVGLLPLLIRRVK